MPDRLFIACSVSGLKVAEKLQTFLSPKYQCTLWTADTFMGGESALESLLNESKASSFAVILLTPDDEVVSGQNGQKQHVPRDNLIFEAGLFLSALGRKRVALCMAKPPGLKLPTDLAGQNTIDFSIDEEIESQNFQHVVVGLAKLISDQFTEAPQDDSNKDNATNRDEPLDFGDSRLIQILVDSAIQRANRRDLRKEIELAIDAGKVFPTKLFYATEDGTDRWLALTRDHGYSFFSSSVSLLRKNSDAIAAAIEKELPNTAPDLVSLGSGDGEKDTSLVRAMHKKLAHNDPENKITYYPIDFSLHLIEETLKSFAEYIDSNTYRVKPIIGDLLELRSFRHVYDHFENPNLFSILGNTIGNNDELALVNAIRVALSSRDFVLIEVNTDVGAISASAASDFIVSEKNLRHNFSPLQVLGTQFDKHRFKFHRSEKLSACPNTISIETYYQLNGSRNVRVAVNHRYNFESFCDWISKTLGCKILLPIEEENVGVVLLYKQ